MTLPPKPAPKPSAIAGALWLNGIVWGLLVLCYVRLLGPDDGGYFAGVGALLIGVVVAGLGMVSNAVLCLWKLWTAPRQALAYGIGGLPLAVVFFWLMTGLAYMGAVGG